MASVLKVKNTFSDDFDLIIATYSSGRKFLISKDDESEEEIVIPEVATQTAKNIILNQGMSLCLSLHFTMKLPISQK
jgi:hypothetical protein